MYREVHYWNTGHTQRAVGVGEGAGHPVVGPQVGEVGRGREDHRAERALHALRRVNRFLF